MTSPISIIGIFFGLSVILFQLLWMLFLIHSAIRGNATLATPRRSIHVIIDAIRNTDADTSVIYDLGCGKGLVTCALKKAFPKAQVFGIDNDPIQIFAAKIRSFFFGASITYRCADLFTTSLANATCVFAYCPLTMMPAVGTKLFRELKPGTAVITNAQQFPEWSPIASTGKFFVYKKT